MIDEDKIAAVFVMHRALLNMVGNDRLLFVKAYFPHFNLSQFDFDLASLSSERSIHALASKILKSVETRSE